MVNKRLIIASTVADDQCNECNEKSQSNNGYNCNSYADRDHDHILLANCNYNGENILT